MSSELRPRLFLVGAPKCGTSAMANYLAQHPEIGLCRVKEPNFFNRDLALHRCRSEAEYLALFPVGERTRLLAEASVLYLCSREAPAAIRSFAPEARILVMLRNPVDAMHAWHSQMVFTGNEPIGDFPEALRAEPERRQGRRLPAVGIGGRCPEILCYRDLFRYADQIRRYLDTFGADRVLILAYEEFQRDPLAAYASVVASVDVDPSFVPDVEVVNPHKVRRSPRLHRILKRTLAAPARRLLSPERRLAWIATIDRWSSRSVRRAEIPAELYRELQAEFLPDVTRLSDLLGVDFSHWCKSPPAPANAG